MTAEFFQQIEAQGGVVDLSARAKFRLSGGDRVRYLNGQVTNDVRKTKADEALYACVTNLKGKIEADIFIHASPDGESLLLDAEPDLREPLAVRLERYIIADDAESTDVSDEWRLMHVFGAAATNLDHGVKCQRFGVPGFDVWLNHQTPFSIAECPILSAEDLETWRICRGIPRWPNELNVNTFPPEAGLEESVMDFHKGCYIGQEILSRIKTTGKMPRRLVKWSEKQNSSEHFQKGEGKLFVRAEDGSLKEVGEITSTCLHPVLDRWFGLAYVRQGSESAHSLLLADDATPRIFTELEIY